MESTPNENANAFDQIPLLSESTDKIRKRVLLSSTFASAYHQKQVLNIFGDLRNCKTVAPQLFRRAALN